MYYKQELIDLSKDTPESCLAVKIAGLSLVPSGKIEFVRVKISDLSQEGRDLIKEYLKKGWRVKSIKD